MNLNLKQPVKNVPF